MFEKPRWPYLVVYVYLFCLRVFVTSFFTKYAAVVVAKVFECYLLILFMYSMHAVSLLLSCCTFFWSLLFSNPPFLVLVLAV